MINSPEPDKGVKELMKNKFTFRSIRFKLVVGALVIFLVLILTVFSNYYLISEIRNRAALSYQNTIQLYIKEMDDTFEKIEKWMTIVVVNNEELTAFKSQKKDLNYYNSFRALRNELDILKYNFGDEFNWFIFTNINHSYVSSTVTEGSVQDRENLKNYFIDIMNQERKNSDTFFDNWLPFTYNGKSYIIKGYYYQGEYIGCWVETNALLQSLNSLYSNTDDYVLLVDSDMNILSNQETYSSNPIELRQNFNTYYNWGKYLVIQKPFKNATVSIYVVIANWSILSDLSMVHKVFFILSLTTLLMIPIGIFYLRKVVLMPIKSLTKAMVSLGEGNLDVRIEDYSNYSELQLANDTFNHMIGQIKELKIDVYEKELERKKIQLDYMQTKIKPHFFLNCLNIIHTMARLKDFQLIQKMSTTVSDYMRYLFRIETSMVLLFDELEHTKSYLEIQQLRYPDAFEYKIVVEEDKHDYKIPPLVIQTFVENIFKHAVNLDHNIQLSIVVTDCHFKGNSCVQITITDKGKGFSKEVLQMLQKGESLSDTKGQHIGINNIQSRLNLIYNDLAKIEFSNGEFGGARIDIIVPNLDNLEMKGEVI